MEGLGEIYSKKGGIMKGVKGIVFKAGLFGLAALVVAAFGSWPAYSAGTTVTFDFDTGTPALIIGQNVPFDQTSLGVTAHFSSPQGPAFSVQSDASTGFNLSQFSGHYVYDNNPNMNTLDIAFSQQLTNITLTFATADFNQTELPTIIHFTAYENSTGTPPVGIVNTRGKYGMDTMPMGTLSFDSGGQPFNLVELVLPVQAQGVSDFYVDNIVVTTMNSAPIPPIPSVPEPGSLALLALALPLLAPLVHRGRGRS